MNKPAKPPRRVVQLAATPTYSDAPYGGVVVLLDDGSLWERSFNPDAPWYRVPGPPGTEPAQD